MIVVVSLPDPARHIRRVVRPHQLPRAFTDGYVPSGYLLNTANMASHLTLKYLEATKKDCQLKLKTTFCRSTINISCYMMLIRLHLFRLQSLHNFTWVFDNETESCIIRYTNPSSMMMMMMMMMIVVVVIIIIIMSSCNFNVPWLLMLYFLRIVLFVEVSNK